ncbi:MAG TPA: transglutaminase-like domain-containing protein [Mobilitalea sp.]|nr:transglutaminase-like domain-containing protein [Mobilitalea sp.]
MFKDRDKTYQIYHTILSTALTWAFVLAINEYYVLRVHVLVCALFSFIPAVLVYFFDCNRRNTVSYLMLLSLFSIAGLFLLIWRINPIDWINSIVEWCWEYDFTEALYAAAPAHFLALGIALAATILFYLFMKNQAIKVILAILLFGVQIYFSVISIELSKLVVGICTFYILSILVEASGKLYSRRLGKDEKKAGILYLAPVCLLLAVMSVSMPSKAEPIQWKGIKNIYYNVKDKINYIFTEWDFFVGKGKGEFSLAMTGYSEDNGNLGNSELTQSDKVALIISGYNSNAPVYLIGSVSDIYTGNSWEKSRLDIMEGEKEYLQDYRELVYALSRQERETLENKRFVERKLMDIKFKNIKTKTFFHPSKSSWYDINSTRGKNPKDDGANITFSKAQGEGTSYDSIYYEMNLQSEEFQQMLRDADEFSYEESGTMSLENLEYLEGTVFVHDSIESIMARWNFYEILGDRAALIKELYTGLPETLPDRVGELAYEITTDADTTYDKLKAIESYLLEYTYNVKPGRLPADTDFVDYFLFDNKKGYCTSFATAMAVLARCIDIPTRYVEGFVVDKEDKVENKILVRNNKAHAWVEAYIEGIGWIPFEATPPFYESRYVTWTDYRPGLNSAFVDYSYLYSQQPTGNLPVLPRNGIKIKQKEKLSNTVVGGIIIASTLLFLTLLLVIYYNILSLLYRRAYDKADTNRKMYLLFLRILTILKSEGFTLEPQETILMLADRVKDTYQYHEITIREIAQIYMGYRYGEVEITVQEQKKVDIFYQGLHNMQKDETGKLKMLLKEFVFLTRRGNR